MALLNLRSNPSETGQQQEAKLLKRLQAGDKRAFEILYERHMPPVYRYALRMTGSAACADDVVQELFLALIRIARGYLERFGCPFPAAATGSRNQCLRELRARAQEWENRITRRLGRRKDRGAR